MHEAYIPVIVRAEYKKDFSLTVTFDNGIVKLIDFTQWIGRGPLFEPLRDKKYFKKFFVDGWTISWPNGADIAPETLYNA